MTFIDWTICGILLVSTLTGFSRGFLRTVFSLFGLLLGLAVAGWNYHRFTGVINQLVHQKAIAQMLSFLFVALVIMIVVSILGSFAAKLFHAIGLGGLDKIAGGLFGIVQGAFLVTLGVAAIVAFIPGTHWLEDSRLVHYFFGLTHLSSHITPDTLEERIQQGVHGLANSTPRWLHPER